MLEWIGKPYRAQRVDQHDPSYRKINPAGAVPALDYGGERPLTQCSAILQYLAETHPAADLLDRRCPEQAAVLQQWAAFLTGDLHPAFFPSYFPGRYTVAMDAAAQADVRAASIPLVRTKIVLLDRHLDGRVWMVGDKRTILDAYVTPMLNWAAAMLPGGLAEFPACRGHHQRMHADPDVRRAMAEESARSS